jgi:hypothetical protein
MKTKNNLVLTIIGAAILLTFVSMSTLYQQQVYAPRNCGSCVEFKKLTHELEKAVIGLVEKPNGVPPSPVVRDLLQTYAEDVNRIFLGGPDTIPELVGDYQQKVLSLLSAPPEPDKNVGFHSGIDFMTDLHILIHDFEKAVINAVTDPED